MALSSFWVVFFSSLSQVFFSSAYHVSLSICNQKNIAFFPQPQHFIHKNRHVWHWNRSSVQYRWCPWWAIWPQKNRTNSNINFNIDVQPIMHHLRMCFAKCFLFSSEIERDRESARGFNFSDFFLLSLEHLSGHFVWVYVWTIVKLCKVTLFLYSHVKITEFAFKTFQIFQYISFNPMLKSIRT